jgi:hypothetical protein
MAAAQEINIDLMMEEGDPLGATPDEHLIIQRVQTGTIADGKLQVGDKILKIKGIRIRDLRHFFQLLRYAPPHATLTILRHARTQAPVDTSIPEDRKKNITPRSGFKYLLGKITLTKGQRLGLTIRSYQNRVLVSQIDAGSRSSEVIQRLDHIIDINADPVTDKKVADDLITQSVKNHGSFSCLIARPVTDAAKKEIEEALNIKMSPPSERLAPDVRRIAEAERDRIRLTGAPPRPSTLRRPNAPPPTHRVTFNETANQTFPIGNDNVGKTLAPVRK